MYKLLSAFILLSLMSCENQLDHAVQTTFFTQDSLYEITFTKPIKLDTFYSWMDYDDNACSDEHKYRFSKKNFPAQKETGFFWTSFADSTYRLTFRHIEKYDCTTETGNVNWITSKEYLLGLVKGAHMQKERLDTIFSEDATINGRDFVVAAYTRDENYKNGYVTHYIDAFTTIDGNLIRITADCRTSDSKGFIDRMNNVIRTIQIKKVR